MGLMRLTPCYMSIYFWLAQLAFVISYVVGMLVLEPTTTIQRILVWLPLAIASAWLTKLAGQAQFEADWELPKTPRIPVE